MAIVVRHLIVEPQYCVAIISTRGMLAQEYGLLEADLALTLTPALARALAPTLTLTLTRRTACWRWT